MQIIMLNVCRCIFVSVSMGVGHKTRKGGKGIKEGVMAIEYMYQSRKRSY